MSSHVNHRAGVREEQLHVEKLAELAGWHGSLRRGDPTREEPDFVFGDAAGVRFGLEHTRVFSDMDVGAHSERPGAAAKNSRLREAEQHRNKWLMKLASEYYDQGGVPIDLNIGLYGRGLERGLQKQRGERLRMEVLRHVRPAASHLPVWEWHHAEIRDIDEALEATVSIVRLPNEQARYVRGWEVRNNSIAWRRKLPPKVVQGLVDKKAPKLTGYRGAMDNAEVGLVVVADRMAASGKVAYEGQPIDCRGFAFVYLLLFPFECIKVA